MEIPEPDIFPLKRDAMRGINARIKHRNIKKQCHFIYESRTGTYKLDLYNIYCLYLMMMFLVLPMSISCDNRKTIRSIIYINTYCMLLWQKKNALPCFASYLVCLAWWLDTPLYAHIYYIHPHFYLQDFNLTNRCYFCLKRCKLYAVFANIYFSHFAQYLLFSFSLFTIVSV